MNDTAVIQILIDAFTPAQLSDAVLAPQAFQHNSDLLLRRMPPPGPAPDLPNTVLGPVFLMILGSTDRIPLASLR